MREAMKSRPETSLGLELFGRRFMEVNTAGLLKLCLASTVMQLMMCFVSGLNPEGQALLSFKASITQDPEGVLSNWVATDETPCGWPGIWCTENGGGAGRSVTSLSIPKAKLVGSLSPHLGSLSRLRHLNLHGNNLGGTVPPDLFNASSLERLVLLDNQFSGPLPEQIGSLTQLQILDLSNNAFSYSIPNSIANCLLLKRVVLNNNKFSGSIPAGIGSSLTSLLQLDLSSNLLNGPIPPDLGNLSSLQGTLNLSNNHLSGSIPVSLGNLPVSVNLDLSNNNLSGPIPQNGTLGDQGPTAFLGNPRLCGTPLQNPCSVPPPLATRPKSGSHKAGAPPATMPVTPKSRGLSKGVIAAIAIGDASGIAFICLVFLYCFWQNFSRQSKSVSSSSGGGDSTPGGWLCISGTKDGDASQKDSDQSEHGDLVALDNEVAFNLDQLLKASAYVLGNSGVGIVYKVILPDGLTLAVRRLGEGGSNRIKEFEAEVETIGRIRHPNIVSLRAYYWAVDEKLLVYDFIPNGSLVSALQGHALAMSQPLLWSSRLRIAKGIARGLAYLHECSTRKYVHGDIKPSNILLDLNMEPYIADFGLNSLLNIAGNGVAAVQSGITGASLRSNSPAMQATLESSSSRGIDIGLSYQAPEAGKSSKPTQKWDVYSFGLISLELLTGRPPVIQLESSNTDLVKWVETSLQEMKPLPQIVDPILADEMHRSDEMLTVLKMARACVSEIPDQRPSMEQATETLNKINGTF